METEHKIPQTMDEAKTLCKGWPIIYPAYLNKEYSLQQGRRVNKNIAVNHP